MRVTNGMPLELGNVGNLNEHPLSSGELEAGLEHAQFHGTCVQIESRSLSCKKV